MVTSCNYGHLCLVIHGQFIIQFVINNGLLPSGKRLHNYGRSQLLLGKLITIVIQWDIFIIIVKHGSIGIISTTTLLPTSC